MKIKMITLAAGPNGNLEPGQEVDVPVEFAQQLIEGGYAVEIEEAISDQPSAISEEKEQKIEEAVVKPKEKAVSRKRKS